MYSKKRIEFDKINEAVFNIKAGYLFIKEVLCQFVLAVIINIFDELE